MSKYIYAPDSGLQDTEYKVAALAGAVRDNNGNMLDSTNAQSVDVIKNVVSDAKNLLPKRMVALMDRIELDTHKALAVSSLLDGIAEFRAEHGFDPSADMIDAAISQAENVADGASTLVLPDGYTLDSVSSNNASATLAHQPNRIALAITGALSEAIPFGAYLPSDLKSNESRLAIISAIAGSTFGAYKSGDILDGTSGGQVYTRSERMVGVTMAGDRATATFKITARTGGLGDAVPLLRNRTAVMIDGFPSGMEQSSDSGTATSLISGQVVIAGADFVITGQVNVETGVGSLAFTPALPAGTLVEVQGFIDFEKKPDLIPAINTVARSFKLYCSASRVMMSVTPDSRSQTQAELGADGLTIATQAARTQAANERYILALRKAKGMARRTSREYNFDAERQLVEKTRAMIWRDFGSFMARVDQEVANQTMEYGLEMMYVGDIGMSQFLSMDSTDFVPSGVASRPGIYRLGKYKGKYDVYYDPYVVEETENEIEILCIGRSPQVARNPIVMSDAVPQTLIPLAINKDLVSGAALYSRSLTEVNPHLQSAIGCALIKVENIYALAA
jgi:hypothetical protein